MSGSVEFMFFYKTQNMTELKIVRIRFLFLKIIQKLKLSPKTKFFLDNLFFRIIFLLIKYIYIFVVILKLFFETKIKIN